MKPLAALFYLMLGYTIGGLQFGGGARDVTWGGLITIMIGVLRYAAGYLILNPASKELAKTPTTRRLYRWSRHRLRNLAYQVKGIAHHLEHHEGPSYSCRDKSCQPSP